MGSVGIAESRHPFLNNISQKSESNVGSPDLGLKDVTQEKEDTESKGKSDLPNSSSSKLTYPGVQTSSI